MASVKFIRILFVSVFFGVFSEGVTIGEDLITTSAGSLLENIKVPDFRDRFTMGILKENDVKEVKGTAASTVNILYDDRRNEYPNEDVNFETSHVFSPKLWQSSGLKLEEPSKPSVDDDDEDEKDPIMRDTNYKPKIFKEANLIEMADNTVTYADIVHIGPQNYDIEPANVNILNARSERAIETTESTTEDMVEDDRSSLISNINTMGQDDNVANIGRPFFLNKVIFRVQLQMEYDTDNIPPDIKTDRIEILNFKQSPAEVVESENQKENGDNDKKSFQEEKTTQSNGYNRNQKSIYNSEEIFHDSIAEHSTENAISSRNLHAEENSIDVHATTNEENILFESTTMVGKSIAEKIAPRSNFPEDYPSVSNENASDMSDVSTDEINANESSIIDLVTESDTRQHGIFDSTDSRDITVGDTPVVEDAQAVMEKRLERSVFIEIVLGVVIIISTLINIIQMVMLVKTWKGMRNKYECTAVP